MKFISAEISGLHQPTFLVGEIDKGTLGDEVFGNNTSKQCLRISKPSPKIEDISQYVAGQYQMTIAELTSLSRARRYSEPRAIIVWLASEFNTATLTNAASLFKKDVTQFIRKIRKLKNNKPQYLEKIREEFNKSISQT